MKKYFIVTDVHGFYDEMIAALNKAGYDGENPDHIFVSLGDLLDRGRQPKECLDFVNAIPKERKILIYGNHEWLLDQAIGRRSFMWNDFSNGTARTVYDLYAAEHNITSDDELRKLEQVEHLDILDWMSQYQPYKDYISSTELYAVRGFNIFVHGWVPSYVVTLGQLDETYPGDWLEAAWDNGMRMCHINGPILRTNDEKDGICTVFCGHWHCSWARFHYDHEIAHQIPYEEEWANMTEADRRFFFRPHIEPGIVALDACTAFSHIVNCYVLREE